MIKSNSQVLQILIVVLGIIFSIFLGAISFTNANPLFLLISLIVFILTISIAYLLSKQTKTVDTKIGDSTAIKIVAIDDEADILRLIRIKLSKEGFNVSTASDGDEGIKVILKVIPDVVIVDVMMPGKDGYQVISEIKKKLGEKAPIAIMLTSKAEEVDMVRGFTAGADDYITKPFSPRELIERINVSLIKVSKKST